MKKISYYLKRYWYAYIFAFICMTISVSLDLLSPQITRRIIDDVIVGGNLSILNKLLLAIFMIGVGRFIFQYLKEVTFDMVSSKIACDIRRNLFRHIQTLSIQFFDKTNTGELMSRVKDDVDKIWGALGFVGMLIIEVVLHTSIAFFFILRLSPKLSILPLIAVPTVACIAVLMEKKLGSVYEHISEENAVLNTVAEENLAGVRTVKAFAREKFEINKFLSRNKKYYDLNMQQSKVFIKYQPYFQLVTKILPISIVVCGGYMVINKEITLGTLGAFLEYSNNIVWPMEIIGWLINDLSSAFASNNKIKKIFEENPIITEKEDPVVLGCVKGSITFEKVSFSQGEKEILKDVSFQLEAGKTIGIMGGTGAGKSSIINLLQRHYDVNQGEIKLDGINIKDLSLKELRSNQSIVMQDVFLFSDTVSENIKFGKKNSVDREEILHALSNAQAIDFVEHMDQQYDTVIGERGVGMSGGQKQRISIARALAKKAPVLILDDSTSALDMDTENLIQQGLNKLKDTTKIIIAHRISAVRNADEILILQDGIIQERGSHEELLKARGYYYETYIAQYGEYLNEKNNYDDEDEVVLCP